VSRVARTESEIMFLLFTLYSFHFYWLLVSKLVNLAPSPRTKRSVSGTSRSKSHKKRFYWNQGIVVRAKSFRLVFHNAGLISAPRCRVVVRRLSFVVGSAPTGASFL
jgi:hypothetical protein